jgi:hypothetical protein
MAHAAVYPRKTCDETSPSRCAAADARPAPRINDRFFPVADIDDSCTLFQQLTNIYAFRIAK